MEVAAEIDHGEAATVSEEVAAGVEGIAWRDSIGADQIVLDQPISCLQDLPAPALSD